MKWKNGKRNVSRITSQMTKERQDVFLNTIFVSSHMYPENPEGTQVIVGSMNMGYISDTARNRTHNLFRPKREPIPLGPMLLGQACLKSVWGEIVTDGEEIKGVTLLVFAIFFVSTTIMYWISIIFVSKQRFFLLKKHIYELHTAHYTRCMTCFP